MYLTGLALFAAASLVAAFAPSPPVLIAAQAFLAVAAAAMLPATLALIRIYFDDEHERGIAIGVWGTMAAVGAALGPIVGGLLLQHFWWGSVFLLNIPVVLLALAATVALVPGGSGHRDRPWDLIASLQAMVALVGLVYAIQEATRPDPMPLAIVLALLAAGRAGMASSIESVSYELGSLAGITVLETILTAIYAYTIRLPATARAQAAGSIDQARAAAGHLPAGQAHTLLAAAASAFDNGYIIALAVTAIALAAGSAFTYRYLKRQPATSTGQEQHPEPAHNGGKPLEPTGSGRRTAPAPQR